MDNIIGGFRLIIKCVKKCRLTRYHIAAIFLLLLVQRALNPEPSEYIKEIYYRFRFATTPTKLLTWPVRMALCFLLALPNVPNFPLGLITYDKFIFPFVFFLQIISCLLLGLHVTNYCNMNGSNCFYSDERILEEFQDYNPVFVNVLLQLFITTHLIYTIWLFKSIMHILKQMFRKIYKWVVRHVVPKVIPVCRVIVLLFVLNLQEVALPILCVYIAGKLFMELWLLPLIGNPFAFDDEDSDTDNRVNYENDGDSSSEMSDEFEDILEPSDE